MKSLQAVAKIAFATTALPLYFLPIISLNKNGFAEGVVIPSAIPAPPPTKKACDGLQSRYQAAKRELLRDLETSWDIVYEKGNVAAFQKHMHALLRDQIGRDVGQGGKLRKRLEIVVGALSDEAEAESAGESSVDEEKRASRGSDGGAAAEGLFRKVFVSTANSMLQHHESPDEEARRNSGEGSEQRDTPEERASYSLEDISAFLKTGNGSREKFDKVLYAPCVLVKKIHSTLTLLEHAVLTRVEYQEKCRCELCTVSRFFSLAEPAPAANRNQCKCKPHGASDDLHVNAARVWRGFLDPAYTALNAVQTLRGACKKMRQTYRTLGGRLRTLVSVLQDHARGAALSRRLEDTSVESVRERLERMTLAGEAEADSDRDVDDDSPDEPILGGAFEAEAQTTPERTGWEVASLSVLQGRLEEANSGPRGFHSHSASARLDVLEARLKELKTAATSYDEKQAGVLVLNQHSKISASSSSTMARWRRELRQKSAQWLDLHEDYMMEAGRQSFAENARESRSSIVHSLAKFLGKFLGGDTPTAEGADSRTSTTPYRFAVFRFEGKTVRSQKAMAAASSWSSASSSEDGAVGALHGYQTRRQQFAVVALRIPGGEGPPAQSLTRRTTVRDVFDAPGDERETRKNYARIADRVVLVLLHGRKKNSFKLEQEGSGKTKANEPRKPVLLPLDAFLNNYLEFGPLMHQTPLPFSFLRSVLLDPNFRRFERSAVRSFVEALERAAGVDPATATEVEADLTFANHMIRFQDFAEELRERFHLREEAEMLAREIWGEAVGRHLLMPTEVAPPFSVRFFPTAPRALVVPDEIIANDDKILKAAGADKGLMLEVSRRFFDRVLNYEEEPANAALAEATRKWLDSFTSSGDRLSSVGGGETMQAWGGGGAAGNPTLRFELELAKSAFQYSLRSADRVVDAVKAASMQVERSCLRSATVFSIPLGETGKARGKEQALFAKSFGVVGLKSGVLQFPHATLTDSPELFTPGAHEVQTRWYKRQRRDWVPAEEWAAGVVGGAGHGHLAHLGLKAVPLFLSGEGGASSQSHDQDRGALRREDPRNSATQQWQYGPKNVVVIGSNAAWREWTADDGALLKGADRDAAGRPNTICPAKLAAQKQYLEEWRNLVQRVRERKGPQEAVVPAEESEVFSRTKLRLKLQGQQQQRGRGPSTTSRRVVPLPAKYQASPNEIPAGERWQWIPATSDALWREARSFLYGGTYKEPLLLGEEEEEVKDELHDDDENVVGKRFILAFNKAWAEEQRTQQASGEVDRARNVEEGQRRQTGFAFDEKSSVFLHRFCDDSMLGRTSGARFGVVSYDLQALLL